MRFFHGTGFYINDIAVGKSGLAPVVYFRNIAEVGGAAARRLRQHQCRTGYTAEAQKVPSVHICFWNIHNITYLHVVSVTAILLSVVPFYNMDRFLSPLVEKVHPLLRIYGRLK